ncbi:hypothetical protein Ancab_007962 [Ancistrocladus abbreviatus]
MKYCFFDLYSCCGGGSHTARSVAPSPLLPTLEEVSVASNPIPTPGVEQRTPSRTRRRGYVTSSTSTEWTPSLPVISEDAVAPVKADGPDTKSPVPLPKSERKMRLFGFRINRSKSKKDACPNYGNRETWDTLMAMIPPAAFSPTPFMF